MFRLDLAPERVHKLVAELQALIDADLTHSAIAAPIAAGISGVSAYLAQDFVAAESADVVAREHGPAPAAQAVRVALQAAAALDYALDANVVHGSLHPRDVLVSPDDTRLTGIGIAQVLERIGAVAPVRRPYSAPERMAGAAWDGRADVFSLAAIVHELLWGRRITGLGELAAAALTPIEGANLDALRRLFALALQEKPSDRMGSPVEFAGKLSSAIGIGLEPIVAADVVPVPGSAQDRTGGLPPLLGIDRLADEPSHPVIDSIPFLEERKPTVLRTARDVPGAPHEDELRLPLEDDDSDELPLALELPPDTRAVTEIRVADHVAQQVAIDEPDRVDEVDAEPPAKRIEVLPLALSEPPMERPASTASSADAAETPSKRTAPAEPLRPAPMFGASESALERTRSAVWPLVLALGVGLSVGFALGYGVANRPGSEVTQSDISQPPPAPAATGETTSRSVPETEVRLKSAPAAAGARSETAATAPPPTRVPPPASSRAERLEEPVVKPPAESPRARGAGSPPASTRAESAVRRLVIRSTPPGATAFVDGREVGHTPFTIESIALGSHTVRVTHEGYVGQERKVAVAASQPTQSVSFALERSRSAPPAPATPSSLGRGSATLTIESRPLGASVTIDGKPAGRTPLTLSDISEGMHTVSIELAGYNSVTTSVRVAPGQKNRLAASLEQ